MAPGILVIDDHAAIAEALTLTLRSAGFDPSEALPATELHVGGALAALHRLEPDVVLVDLQLGAAGSGLPIVHALCQAGATVVVFTASNAATDVANCLRAGAVGYINKAEPFDVIAESARRAALDGQLIGPEERQALFDEADVAETETAGRLARLLSLTDREREVLGMLAKGASVKQISHASSTSVGTVRVHVDRIRKKLDVDTQFAAVTLYLEFNS